MTAYPTLLFAWLLPSAHAQPLGLAEVVRLAVDRSPDVQAARRRGEEAGLEEPLLLSNLDTRLETGYLYSDDQAPRASPAFQGSRSTLEQWNTGLAQNTLIGTEARLVWRNERLTNPAPFRVLDPSVDSRLNLELKQPLLRYFWGRPDVARRRRARASVAAAEALARQAREQAAAAAARAWLELRSAQKQAAIKEGGVADAKRLLAKYEEKSRYGLSEESDLLQAKASLEIQETERLIADSQVARARIALQAAVSSPPQEANIHIGEAFLPTDVVLAVPEEAALERRADIQAARRRRESLEWSARVERLDTLPELNLTASYGLAGLGSGYSRAMDDLGGWDHPVKSAGLSLAVPLGMRKERLLRKAALLRFEAARAEEARAEIAARRELRDARESLRLAALRLDAGKRLAELELRKFTAEEANFRRGRSSTDLLIRFQQDIRRAQSELLRAELDDALSRVELARAAGLLPEALAP